MKFCWIVFAGVLGFSGFARAETLVIIDLPASESEKETRLFKNDHVPKVELGESFRGLVRDHFTGQQFEGDVQYIGTVDGVRRHSLQNPKFVGFFDLDAKASPGSSGQGRPAGPKEGGNEVPLGSDEVKIPLADSGRGDDSKVGSNSRTGSQSGVFAISKTHLVDALARGLIFTRKDQADFNKFSEMLNRIQSDSQELNRLREQVRLDSVRMMADAYEEMRAIYQRASGDRNFLNFDVADYQILTQAPELRLKIAEARKILSLINTLDQKRMAARDVYGKTIEVADRAYYLGHVDDGDRLLEYAKDFADAAIGFDPVTGPARPILEFSLGRNLFRPEKEMDDVSLVRASIGIALGIYHRTITKKGFELYIQFGQWAGGPTVGAALLRATMSTLTVAALLLEMPDSTPSYKKLKVSPPPSQLVHDKKLASLLRNVWDKDAAPESAYLPRQIVVERLVMPLMKDTLEQLKMNSNVVRTGKVLAASLQKWIADNPLGLESDRGVAKSVLKDLQKSLTQTLPVPEQ